MKIKFKKTNKFIVFLVLFLLIIICVSVPWIKNSVKNPIAVKPTNRTPIIFVPGSSAGENRFDDLFSLINKEDKHSILKVEVDTNNKLNIKGHVRPTDHEPFFVIAFKNNKDGYINIKKQAYWLNTAINYLSQRYSFNNFSFFGHSNGGLIITLYLEKYFDQSKMIVNRLMMLGSPFNLDQSNPDKKTIMLQYMIANKKRLPKNLIVYLIAGAKNYNNDDLVPVSSVYSGKYVYQNQVKKFTEATITGSDAEHSDLPQNKQVVQLMKLYLQINHRFIKNSVTKNINEQR
ncbi:MAG: alpha/beta hydrolase [Firmicutes bacterium]|uniref:Alpha/beta hydrolase n=1 Tax=Candidatus Gallilactobacillus intestinavium TaxID=2840838 RepID=A0A9D9H5M1_9LACO|nr:alpha/beta hydrolase [Candidatus Gallilactobacillus intestinavium]